MFRKPPPARIFCRRLNGNCLFAGQRSGSCLRHHLRCLVVTAGFQQFAQVLLDQRELVLGDRGHVLVLGSLSLVIGTGDSGKGGCCTPHNTEEALFIPSMLNNPVGGSSGIGKVRLAAADARVRLFPLCPGPCPELGKGFGKAQQLLFRKFGLVAVHRACRALCRGRGLCRLRGRSCGGRCCRRCSRRCCRGAETAHGSQKNGSSQGMQNKTCQLHLGFFLSI